MWDFRKIKIVANRAMGKDVAPLSMITAVAAGAVGKEWSKLVDSMELRCDSNVLNSYVMTVLIFRPGHPLARMLKLDDWGHRDRL